MHVTVRLLLQNFHCFLKRRHPRSPEQIPHGCSTQTASYTSDYCYQTCLLCRTTRLMDTPRLVRIKSTALYLRFSTEKLPHYDAKCIRFLCSSYGFIQYKYSSLLGMIHSAAVSNRIHDFSFGLLYNISLFTPGKYHCCISGATICVLLQSTYHIQCEQFALLFHSLQLYIQSAVSGVAAVAITCNQLCNSTVSITSNVINCVIKKLYACKYVCMNVTMYV